MVLGMTQRERAQHSQAAATLRMAVESAQQIEDTFAEAHAWRELGFTLKAPDAPASAEAFTRAIVLFNELGLSHEVERTESMK